MDHSEIDFDLIRRHYMSALVNRAFIEKQYRIVSPSWPVNNPFQAELDAANVQVVFWQAIRGEEI